MMEDNKIIATPINDEETVLSLPIKKKELGEFISSLLGQQQSIERHRYVYFDIDHAWLMNLHEIISQRIHQQADAHLTSFSATINFKGGLKRTLTSVEAFETYLETKNLFPVGIKIIWIYLVKFPSKGYPEKQQIAFLARININKISIFRLFFGESGEGEINYQIDHTERTWGDDIESILNDQVVQVTRNSYLQNRFYFYIRVTLSLSILILLQYFAVKIQSDFRLEVYSNFLSSNISSIEEINRKINFIANFLVEGVDVPNFKVREGILFLISSSIPIFIFLITNINKYSFLVLSKEAVKYREEKLQRERRNIFILIASFLFSVLAGIIGNYGFAWLTR